MLKSKLHRLKECTDHSIECLDSSALILFLSAIMVAVYSAALKFFWTCVALELVDDDDDDDAVAFQVPKG